MKPHGAVRLARLLGHVGFALVLAGCSGPTRPYPSRVITDFGGVWGTSGADVYAVGRSLAHDGWHGLILHYDGHEWSPINNDASAYFTSMWGNSGTEQFTVGFLPLRTATTIRAVKFHIVLA